MAGRGPRLTWGRQARTLAHPTGPAHHQSGDWSITRRVQRSMGLSGNTPLMCRTRRVQGRGRSAPSARVTCDMYGTGKFRRGVNVRIYSVQSIKADPERAGTGEACDHRPSPRAPINPPSCRACPMPPAARARAVTIRSSRARPRESSFATAAESEVASGDATAARPLGFDARRLSWSEDERTKIMGHCAGGR